MAIILEVNGSLWYGSWFERCLRFSCFNRDTRNAPEDLKYYQKWSKGKKKSPTDSKVSK